MIRWTFHETMEPNQAGKASSDLFNSLIENFVRQSSVKSCVSSSTYETIAYNMRMPHLSPLLPSISRTLTKVKS